MGNFALYAILSCLAAVCASRQQNTVYLLEEEDSEAPGNRLLVITASLEKGGELVGCDLYNDEKSINEVLESVPEDEIQIAQAKDIDYIMDRCNTLDGGNSETATNEPALAGPAKTTTEGYDGWNVIFPGTKWCGAGDVAKHYDDLGRHADTDKCCRAHDLCNDTLAPGATRNNLTNSSPFTKLSCKCDIDFYNCLDRVNSMISNKIGNLYFNILKRDCYESDYPTTKKCKKYRSIFKITCKEYEKDTKAAKVYQWKKAKIYKKLPFPGPITVTLPWGN